MTRPDGSPELPDKHEHACEYGGFDRKDDPDMPGHAGRFDASFRPEGRGDTFRPSRRSERRRALLASFRAQWRARRIPNAHPSKSRSDAEAAAGDHDKPMRGCQGMTTSRRDLSVGVSRDVSLDPDAGDWGDGHQHQAERGQREPSASRSLQGLGGEASCSVRGVGHHHALAF